jgi:hypothetical protein
LTSCFTQMTRLVGRALESLVKGRRTGDGSIAE